MAISTQNLYRYIRPGLLFEIVTVERTALACVLDARPRRLLARPEGPPPPPGRVILRVPLAGALLQASARLKSLPEDGQLELDTFANVTCCERRASVRVEEPVRVWIHGARPDSPARILSAVNLSSRGIMLGWPDEPEVALGEKVLMIVTLNGRQMRAIGEVVRVGEDRTAIQFTRIEPEDQDYIVNYAFLREHKNLRD